MTASHPIVAKLFAQRVEAKPVMEELERGERVVDENEEVWLVDNAFVMEPSVCGQLLGEVPDLDMRQYTVVRRLSQAEFDAMVAEYFADSGPSPDS